MKWLETINTNTLINKLQEDILICAEGYVFELERRGYVKSGPYVPEVVLEFPEAVKELHREFVRAGSDVVLALTYYAHRDKMKVVGRELDAEKLNRQAVRLAGEVARESGKLVAANICNTWVYDPGNPLETGKQVRAMYEEQLSWAVDEGVDYVVAETFDWFAEADIALDVIKSFKLPAVITFTAVTPTTADGYAFEDACRILSDKGADVVGLNCGRGPATLLPVLAKVVESVECPVAALPVAYRTDADHLSFIDLKQEGREAGFPAELDPFVLTRSEMAEFALAAKDLGVRYIGVCCGGAPHHVRAMAEALGKTVPASRYSPDIAKHAVLGSEDVVRDYRTRYLKEHHESLFTD